MPFPIEIAERFAVANEHLSAGRLEEAQACVLQAELIIENIRPALNPFEELIILAVIATFLKKCGSIQQAMIRFEKVCNIALTIEPDSPQTAGDFWDLGECYEACGRLQEALSSFQTARDICASSAPERCKGMDQKIAQLLKEIRALEKQATRARRVQASAQCFSVNYSLEHCGISSITSLHVRNKADVAARDVKVQVSIPGYTMPCEITIPHLGAGEAKEISSDIKLIFVPDRLAAQMERAKATLEVHINEHLAHRQNIWILAYNECSWQRGHEKALAAFVHPNNAAVGVIAKRALNPLQEITHMDSFRAVRESNDPNRVDKIVQAVYHCLKEQYDLVYDYEPPCWESFSQRVRFPDEVIVEGRGTCNDLMLLVTSILENVLYASSMQPVIVITVGQIQHALVGCWRDEPLSQEVVITNKEQVVRWGWVRDTCKNLPLR